MNTTYKTPVKSVYVLKNGLPVFTKEFGNLSTARSGDNEMLVSGFLTALSSFLKDMQEYGEMRSLVTSTNTRFTFYQADSLLFVACTDGSLSEPSVERFLRRTCMTFMHSFGKHALSSNTINTKEYAGFGSVLEREVLSKELRCTGERKTISSTKEIPVPTMLIPAERVRDEFGFSDAIHDSIIQYIDGNTDVSGIARLSNVNEERVHATLRYLVKQGVVQM